MRAEHQLHRVWVVQVFQLNKKKTIIKYLYFLNTTITTHLYDAPHGENGNKLGSGSKSMGGNDENELISSLQ